MKKHKDFSLWFWVHICAIAVIYLLPFLLSWWWLPVLVLLFYLQNRIFGGCVLTILEFGYPTNCHRHYLSKMGLNPSEAKLSFILDVAVPSLLFLLAVYRQIYLGKAPWLF